MIHDVDFMYYELLVALIRGRRLFTNWALQRIFPFHLTVYLPSVRKEPQSVIEASFHCHHSPLSALISGVFTQSDLTLAFCNNPFF